MTSGGERPRVLIEDWLPVEEIGIESRRESAPIPGQFPKLKTLHVWWARRPLVASASAVLGCLLPAWTPELAATFSEVPELQSEDSFHTWFLTMCGILGDPISAKRQAQRNREAGIKSQANPYTYKPAFKNVPEVASLRLLLDLLKFQWETVPTVLDPTAGGGSIPFEAIRYNLTTVANDLNAVASVVLRTAVGYPVVHGQPLAALAKSWGVQLVNRVVRLLEPFFKAGEGETITNYIFARTVACPRTGKQVPLVPNWSLSRGKKPTAVRLVTERDGVELEAAEFEIVTGSDIDFDPSRGTVARGEGISPWDNLAIDGDYIKSEAQAGRMGSQLYAVAIRTKSGRGFRSPTETDLRALEAAEGELKELLPRWEADDILPTEEVPEGNDQRPHHYGMSHWRNMFSPRQLLVHGTFVDEFRKLVPEVRKELDKPEADAVLTLLALMQAKAINWNALLSSWDTSRDKMRSVFDRHDFAFKWTFAEFEGARELYPWCLDQIVDAYSGIAALLPTGEGAGTLPLEGEPTPRSKVTVTAGNAADLKGIETGSVELVCIDPPYYDNVMYAELSDFFYVWEKRTLGDIHPDLFRDELTDKKNEAVANPARFKDAGKRKNELATADYEAKMTAIFAEAFRVLRDDGVLCVMFTHKRAEAWDTLGMALMEAGFTIETSWPVNTESEHSLHIAKKNAAASTIFLVCRKRSGDAPKNEFFEDIEPEVREAARDALVRFRQAGIEGVDLLLSTYGPALAVISSRWPVLSSEVDELTGRARPLRPEEALSAAREEVVRLQTRNLVGSAIQLDPLTDFTMIAWETFKAEEFPYDEARRLALATGGLDVDDLVDAKILEKKSGTVVLVAPAKRLRRENDDRPGVRRDATSFSATIDAVHTALYLISTDGLPAAKIMLDRSGLVRNDKFKACLQGLVNAIPRTVVEGKWVRKEAELLDRLVTAYFPDVEVPTEDLPPEELRLDV